MTPKCASIRTMRGIEEINAKLDRLLALHESPALAVPLSEVEAEAETVPPSPSPSPSPSPEPAFAPAPARLEQARAPLPDPHQPHANRRR